MTRIAMFPGSFDPVTLGHMDIIRRAAVLFDEVVVAVMHNPEKKGCFPVEKRIAMLEKVCVGLGNVRITASDGLTALFAKEIGACVLIRGVRNQLDLESENDMANINRMLADNIETIYFPAKLEKSNISSTFVRQLAAFGADISKFVPTEVLEEVISAFPEKYSK